ncbi:TetR/AcrR family transcriptional regulator [Kineococcus indalonis]|uniref:TetR/AcrR family transcriptional regulator n=1 Tax=Kineococcus indalonis TaxID=2696566 RepID=UPI001412A8D1|nr:TetR/AcrR family transcriptional regulator [Kineococcus indalonis]NAZ86066.1 TetR family transcriptional regulator [Kineococcus indalonis]
MERPTPRQRRQAATRRALAEHALRLFAERGYEATTVADIADAADVSTRTFFRHVPDKDEAMFAADEDVFALVVEAAAAAPPGTAPLARLLHGVRALAGSAEQDGEVKCARERVLEENPVLRARDLAQQLRWQQQAEAFLRRQGVAADEASLAAGLLLTVWRESYRRWIAASAAPGALGELLDAVVAELPGHLPAPARRARAVGR